MKKVDPDTVKKPNDVGRRLLLKSIAGSAGVVGASTLPNKWVKPTVDAAILPVHAQASGCNLDCDFRFQLDWFATGASSADLDLEVVTPVNGTRIAPKAQNGPAAGTCMQHDGDVTNTADGVETISPIAPNFISAGRYRVFVRNNSNESFPSVRVRVPLACGASLPTASGTGIDFGPAVIDWGSVNISNGGTIAVNLGPNP